MPKTSILISHWAQDNFRSSLLRASLESLFKTAYKSRVEIIVVDNGASLEDSEWLVGKTNVGLIALYIRNRYNMHFAYARNQAYKLSSGDYICVADNDIQYREGWLEECIDFLEKNPGKYLVTPLAADPMNTKPERWVGKVGDWRLNTRAGSNCFVLRRQDFEEIGMFPIHRIAGSKWTDAFVRKGYSVACMPTPKATDMGFRNGYNLNQEIPHKEL